MQNYTTISDKKHRTGNEIVKVTIQSTNAIVSFADILAAAEITPSDNAAYSWKTGDGMEHTLEAIEHQEQENARGFVSASRHTSGQIITIDRRDAESWGIFAQQNGESKQVAAQRAAGNIALTIKAIKEEYKNGPDDNIITIDFLDYHYCVGGFDSEYAHGEALQEAASSIAWDMQKDGFTVTGMPEGRIFLPSRVSVYRMQRESLATDYRKELQRSTHYYVIRNRKRRERLAQRRDARNARKAAR